MRRGSLADVRGDPHGCVRWLTLSRVVHGVEVTVVRHNDMLSIFDVRLDQPPREHLPGYPAEHVRVTVLASGRAFAVPINGDNRAWLHRYSRHSISELLFLPSGVRIPWEHLLGSLCLECPDDPDHLRWQWRDGIDAYLRIVQRHLWYEEYWRREGSWPVEDAPHGHRLDGHPHPIITPALRSA